MSFAKEFTSTFKSQIIPKSSIKGMVEDAELIGKNKLKKEGPSVSSGVSIEEFTKRYKGLLVALYINIFAMTVCVFQLIDSSSLLGKTLCVVLLTMCAMYYFRYSFTAWRARSVFSEWDSRNQNKIFYYSDFIQGINMNWKNILPLTLNNNNI